MTTTSDYDIVGSYNNQRVSSIDAERTVNMFEYIDPLGKKPKALVNTSGLINTNATFGGATNGFRAEFVFNNIHYMLIGNRFYSRNVAGTVSFLGVLLNTSAGYVGIDANTYQIILVDGINGYIWDTLASTFIMITDTSFPPMPLDVCFLDGFFVVIHGGTNNFQFSMINQGLVWGPASNTFTASSVTSLLTIANTANYQTGVPVTVSNSGGALPMPLVASTIYYVIRVSATTIRLASTLENARAGTFIALASNGTGTQTILSSGQLQQGAVNSHPGTLVACRTLHRRLFFFSQFFTEVWYNAGLGTNLPVRRDNSSLMEYGTPAVGSIAVGFDKMFFLSQDRDGLGSVMEVIGTQSVPASNRALDFQLAQYAELGQVEDCRAFLIKENGLIFYRMNFTLANHTFVYNVTLSNPENEESKLWHEEEILNGNRHPAQTHAYFNGQNYVGDYKSPILYQVDNEAYTNAGELIRRMRISKAFTPPGYQRLRVDRLQLDLLQGNIANLQPIYEDLNLLTEDHSLLLTEDGIELLLEQKLQLTDPQQLFVFLSISKDGGQTYGYELKAPMGNIGQRTYRTLWRKLGITPRGQSFVTKFQFFDAVPFVILGGAWAMEVLSE